MISTRANWLFDAKGGGRVDLHGASSRDVAGEGGGGQEQRGDGGVGDRVERSHTEEEIHQVAR